MFYPNDKISQLNDKMTYLNDKLRNEGMKLARLYPLCRIYKKQNHDMKDCF